MYSNCCCSCSFELEIIKVGQSSHKMYSNKILNFQESTTILNACTKKSGNLLKAPHIFLKARETQRERERQRERQREGGRGTNRHRQGELCRISTLPPYLINFTNHYKCSKFNPHKNTL